MRPFMILCILDYYGIAFIAVSSDLLQLPNVYKVTHLNFLLHPLNHSKAPER